MITWGSNPQVIVEIGNSKVLLVKCLKFDFFEVSPHSTGWNQIGGIGHGHHPDCPLCRRVVPCSHVRATGILFSLAYCTLWCAAGSR